MRVALRRPRLQRCSDLLHSPPPSSLVDHAAPPWWRRPAPSPDERYVSRTGPQRVATGRGRPRRPTPLRPRPSSSGGTVGDELGHDRPDAGNQDHRKSPSAKRPCREPGWSQAPFGRLPSISLTGASWMSRSGRCVDRPNRKPWPNPQPASTASSYWACVSMPSATVVRPRSWAKDVMVRTRRTAFGSLSIAANERAIDLDEVHWHRLEIVQARLAGAEIVQADRTAEAPDRIEGPCHLVEIDDLTLGEFEREPDGRDAHRRQLRFDRGYEIRIVKLPRRHVHRDEGQAAVVGADAGNGPNDLFHHPFADRDDKPGFFGERHERCRRHVVAVVGLPSQECFEAGDLEVLQPQNRLIFQP